MIKRFKRKVNKVRKMQITVDQTNMKIENGKLIIDITADIEKVLNAGKVQLSTLKVGEHFKIGDREFMVLEQTVNATKVIAADFHMSMKFGDSNDWKESDIRRKLNGDYLKELAAIVGSDSILGFRRDLTSLDGLDDYGYCDDKISLLSAAEYAKYHKILGVNEQYSDWWYLITPYSTPSNDYARGVCCVISSGTLNWYDCGYCYGVRPFLTLDSSILVLL